MRNRIICGVVILVFFFVGCASSLPVEEFEESLEKPLPYRVGISAPVLSYLAEQKEVQTKGVALQIEKPPISPKFVRNLAKRIREHRIFTQVQVLETPKIRVNLKEPLKYLNSSQLQELLDAANRRDLHLVVIPTVDRHQVVYHGFNSLWWLSINLWWFLFGSQLWVKDEDFSANLDITLDFYSTRSRSLVYSESFHAEVRHSLSDWDTRLAFGDLVGYTLLFQKHYSPEVMRRVQNLFWKELEQKIYVQIIRTLIRKFVPYSKTSKFLSDLNGVGFPPTIKIDLEPHQKFDLPEAKVELSLGDDRGIQEVRFRFYQTPSNDPGSWRELPQRMHVRSLEEKRRFRRYELVLYFPKKGRYLLEVECDDEDKNNAKWQFFMEYTEVERKLLAVVIGVGKFKYGNIPPLKYAAKDAHDLAELLRAHRRELNLKLLIELTEEKATLEEIRHALGTVLAKEASPYDTVLIFYSGHGVAVPDPTSPDKDGMEKYFVPYDADRNSWYSSALPMRELQMILERINSRRVLIFLDSCYSGAGARSLSGANVLISADFQNRFKRRGLLVMTASDTNQYSYESKKLKNGYFSYFLIQGLKGQADANKDGKVSAYELVQYVRSAVPEAVRREEKKIQTPTITNRLYGDFVLFVSRLDKRKGKAQRVGMKRKSEKKAKKKESGL